MIIEQRVKVAFDTGPQLYTYKWCFSPEDSPIHRRCSPLEVGDRVLVPSNWRNPNESEATVVELGSDWPGGPVAQIIRRVDAD